MIQNNPNNPLIDDIRKAQQARYDKEDKAILEAIAGLSLANYYLTNQFNVSDITEQTPSKSPKMSGVSSRIRSIKIKKGRSSKMLNLSYTIEKNGIEIAEVNRLMISESQINDLMDSLVANGYTVGTMSVAPATL